MVTPLEKSRIYLTPTKKEAVLVPGAPTPHVCTLLEVEAAVLRACHLFFAPLILGETFICSSGPSAWLLLAVSFLIGGRHHLKK